MNKPEYTIMYMNEWQLVLLLKWQNYNNDFFYLNI